MVRLYVGWEEGAWQVIDEGNAHRIIIMSRNWLSMISLRISTESVNFALAIAHERTSITMIT